MPSCSNGHANGVDTFLFTSESVGPGHPDKLCDQISDAVLDAYLSKDPDSKVACECFMKNNQVIVGGEVNSRAHVDIEEIVRGVIRDVGYDCISKGLDYNTCKISNLIDRQSSEIANSVYLGRDPDDIGAGDQGMVFGYATDETEECMPLTVVLAHKLNERLEHCRKKDILPWLRPDSKTQVTVEYMDDCGACIPIRVQAVVISTQHSPDISIEEVREELMSNVIKVVIPPTLRDSSTVFHLNPAGPWFIGGPTSDAGLTGRKIIVDTYGGWGAHGGGAFSGKDYSKIDRSAAYAARWVAKSLVKAKLCRRVLVQISYAIAISHPMSVFINSYGTAPKGDKDLMSRVMRNFDLRPGVIVKLLTLARPTVEQISGITLIKTNCRRFWLLDNAKRLSSGVPMKGFRLIQLGMDRKMHKIDALFRINGVPRAIKFTQRVPRQQKGWEVLARDTSVMHSTPSLTPSKDKQTLYEQYWSSERILTGIEYGCVIKGTIRVNATNKSLAYVTHPNNDSDILIVGKRRNRAMDGDQVYVRIDPKHRWRVIHPYLKMETECPHDEEHRIDIQMLLKNGSNTLANYIGPDHARHLIDNLDGCDVPLVREGQHWWRFFMRTGRVVGVARSAHKRTLLARLEADRITVKPINHLLPLMQLREQVSIGDIENIELVVQLSSWPCDQDKAICNLLRVVKDNSTSPDFTCRVQRVLTKHGIIDADFSDNVRNSADYLISSVKQDFEKELALRRDLRSLSTLTIDPEGASDLDDALHVRRLPSKGCYEVGIHIADVTYYVNAKSAVDKEASRRSTSVYLPDSTIPMLPPSLSSGICSLLPGKDKFTFSVLLEIDEDGNVLNEWIGRTVIRSCAQLTYSNVQAVIDSSPDADMSHALSNISHPHTASDISTAIRRLHKLASARRASRYDRQDGSLNLIRLSPSLQSVGAVDGNKFNLAVCPVLSTASHKLVEEWMVTANECVGRFLFNNSHTVEHEPTALLRHHPAPTQDHFLDTLEKLQKLGISINDSSCRSIRESLTSLLVPHYDPAFVSSGELIEHVILWHLRELAGIKRTALVTCSESHYDYTDAVGTFLAANQCLIKSMNRAEYFCSGDATLPRSAEHYGLGLTSYTHFTSPIRRYFDMLVHRQLSDVLARLSSSRTESAWYASKGLVAQSKHVSVKALQLQADTCNERKWAAKKAQEECEFLFIAHHFPLLEAKKWRACTNEVEVLTWEARRNTIKAFDNLSDWDDYDGCRCGYRRFQLHAIFHADVAFVEERQQYTWGEFNT